MGTHLLDHGAYVARLFRMASMADRALMIRVDQRHRAMNGALRDKIRRLVCLR